MDDLMIKRFINQVTIKEREDGRFEARPTINGKRKSFYGHTKGEVREKIKKYLMKVENGYIEPKKIVFAEYMLYWLKTFKWNRIEDSSYTRLYSVYHHQLKDTIGKKYIGDITQEMIQEFIYEGAKAHPNDPNMVSLSRTGLKKQVDFMRPCLKQAVKEGIIVKNPCEDIIIPKERRVAKKSKKQRAMSDRELELMKSAAFEQYSNRKEYKSRDAFVHLIMVNLGLRVGEMIALRWEDVNFDKQLVYIHRTVQFYIMTSCDSMEHKVSEIKDSTKTDAGERILKLNETVLSYLQILKEYDARNKIVSEYVACTSVGTMHNPKNLQRSLTRLLNRAGITEKTTLHTLRHTFGSKLLREGVAIEVVSELMGHANITITMTKYIHVLKEQRMMAMDMVQIC